MPLHRSPRPLPNTAAAGIAGRLCRPEKRASLAEFIRLADAKLDDYLQRLDTSDAAEQLAGGSRVKYLAEKIAAVRERRARWPEMLAELERTGEDRSR